MIASALQPPVLHTSAGEFPLHEYRLRMAGREWTILHTGEVLTHVDEQRFLNEQKGHLAYGVVLWPAAIVLAHEVAGRWCCSEDQDLPYSDYRRCGVQSAGNTTFPGKWHTSRW